MPELTAGDVRVAIDLDQGARATAWSVGDLDLLSGRSADPVEHGMYPMAPWAGRLRDNAVRHGGAVHPLPATYREWALHGTLLAEPAAIVEEGAGDDACWLVARSTARGAWPWPLHVDLSWHLTPDVLTTVITVVAESEPFPAVVGWHPWFARRLWRGGDLEWSLSASGRLVRGADHLPTGDLAPYDPSDGPFDDAFVVPDGRAELRWPGALTLQVACDAGWFVVFDELPDHVCIEPQSGPPDGVNDGYGSPVTLASPGSPHRLVTTWTMLRDQPADRG